MNKQYLIISLKKEILVSCFLMSLFLLEGGNCYASEQQLLRGTIETPSDNYTVRGRVIDVYGEPLIGATIREKGGANGTVTDIDGRFFLSVPDSAVLQVSFVGYKTLEVNVTGRTMLEIRLQEDAVMLDHVIVTALGIEKDEATLAYSAQKIKGPFTEKALDELIKYQKILFAEECIANGSIGEHLEYALQQKGWGGCFIHLSVRDVRLPHASVAQIKQATGLDAASLVQTVQMAVTKGESLS